MAADSKQQCSLLEKAQRVLPGGTFGNMAADRMVAARFLVGASAEAGTEIEAHTRELQGTLTRIIILIQRNPKLVTVCFRLERTEKPVGRHQYTLLVQDT